MFHPRDAIDRLDKPPPGGPPRRKSVLARRSQPVITPTPLACLLHPAPLNPAALLQTVQQRVERRDVEAERAARTLLDQTADVVAVPRALLDQRQNQKLRAPLLQLARQNV